MKKINVVESVLRVNDALARENRVRIDNVDSFENVDALLDASPESEDDFFQEMEEN